MAVSNIEQSNENDFIGMLILVDEDLDEASQTSCVLRGVVIAPLQCQVEPVKKRGKSTPDMTHFRWQVLMNRVGLRGQFPSTFAYQRLNSPVQRRLFWWPRYSTANLTWCFGRNLLMSVIFLL